MMRVMRVMRVSRRCVHPELHLESQEMLQLWRLQSWVATWQPRLVCYFLEWAGGLVLLVSQYIPCVSSCFINSRQVTWVRWPLFLLVS